MNQELARKRPAIVVNAEPATTRPLPSANKMIIRAASRGQLSAEVTRQWQAGRIERTHRTGRQGGMWIAEVTLKPKRSLARRAALPLAVGAGIVAVAGVGAWFLVRALVAVAPLALGVLALIVLVGAVTGGSVVVSQKVTVHR